MTRDICSWTSKVSEVCPEGSGVSRGSQLTISWDHPSRLMLYYPNLLKTKYSSGVPLIFATWMKCILCNMPSMSGLTVPPILQRRPFIYLSHFFLFLNSLRVTGLPFPWLKPNPSRVTPIKIFDSYQRILLGAQDFTRVVLKSSLCPAMPMAYSSASMDFYPHPHNSSLIYDPLIFFQ